MSTYTDLHNKIQESINVDYKTRITCQKARFLNEENEYWGMFNGKIEVDGSRLYNTTLSNGTIYNAEIVNSIIRSDTGGIIDLQQFSDNIQDISSRVIEDLPDAISETNQRIDDVYTKIEALQLQINSLTAIIDNINTKLETI